MSRWILLSWVTNAIALGVTAWILDGMSFHGSVSAVILASAIFGILNTLLKPILRFVTVPLAVITLGIAWFFVSMFMLWLTDLLVGKFTISGFWTYVWATVIIALVNIPLDLIFRPRASRS